MAAWSRLSPSWRIALVVLAVLGLARGASLVLHSPLLALANNFDQIRYSSCLDIAPWRPGVVPSEANPQAPLQRYAFQPLPRGGCVWSSDLLFTAPLALGWHAAEAAGGRAIHSIRRLGEWRLLAWLLVAAWATCALLAAERPDLALAFLAWFAFVGMDPANTLYFSTFYAEAAALFGFYVCGAGVVVSLVRPTRTAVTVAGAGAALLAASKFQHLILPLLLGAGLLVAGARAQRGLALAVLAGGLLGFAVHVADGLRGSVATRSIATANRADYVLSVLLPATSNRAHVERVLAIEPACSAYAGRSVYVMPAPVHEVCTQVDAWPRAQLWWLLLSDPPALARAAAHAPRSLLPWIPALGAVEDGHYAALPASQPSLSRLFGASSASGGALLALPWLVLATCLVRRSAPQARAYALMCALGSTGVAAVALLGDGDVEFAKHAQLTVNYALAALALPLAAMLASARRKPPA